jgi:hypothetical protein
MLIECKRTLKKFDRRRDFRSAEKDRKRAEPFAQKRTHFGRPRPVPADTSNKKKPAVAVTAGFAGLGRRGSD